MQITFVSDADQVVYPFVILLQLFSENNNVITGQCIQIIVNLTGQQLSLVDCIQHCSKPLQYLFFATNGSNPDDISVQHQKVNGI